MLAISIRSTEQQSPLLYLGLSLSLKLSKLSSNICSRATSTMKPYFSILVFLAHYAAAGDQPELQWDPATVDDCAGWYDNGGDSTCEYIRKIFGISPEEFHSWNPSVGLDCKPWDIQSYCIITQSKLDLLPSTTSSTKISTTTITSATSTLRPSPTAWEEIGCYAENPEMPILEENINTNGDDLSIPKCKDSCYQRAYAFAGVQQGNQCWCSSYVGGEWASNQTDCNTPCTGDQDTICGGKGVLNVFEALENDDTVSSTTSAGDAKSSESTTVGNVKSSASTTVGDVESSVSPTSALMSGAAARNAIWW